MAMNPAALPAFRPETLPSPGPSFCAADHFTVADGHAAAFLAACCSANMPNAASDAA
jgi:S-formylglutathione hydrolase FrmB